MHHVLSCDINHVKVLLQKTQKILVQNAVACYVFKWSCIVSPTVGRVSLLYRDNARWRNYGSLWAVDKHNWP